MRQTREQIAAQSQKAITTINELLERSAASPARTRSIEHSYLSYPVYTATDSALLAEKDKKIAELEARIKLLETQLALVRAVCCSYYCLLLSLLLLLLLLL
jgi:chromosome segregation ATPase